MDIYGADIPGIVCAPDEVQKFFTAVDFIWIADQKLQQVEFFCSEIDLSAGNADAAAFAVHAHISAFQNAFRLCDLSSRRGTAHDRLDARLYLKDVKGLGDIVICTIFQSHDFVHVVVFGCEHYDRNIRKLPNLLAYFGSAQFWQHNVEQNHIKFLLFRTQQRLFSVICAGHFHSVLLQAEPDSFYNQLFIVHNQNFLCHVSPFSRPDNPFLAVCPDSFCL